MYKYSINFLEQLKRNMELALLAHNQEIMNVAEEEDYDIEEDANEHLSMLPKQSRKIQEHLDDIYGAISFLNGDTAEMEKFFNNQD